MQFPDLHGRIGAPGSTSDLIAHQVSLKSFLSQLPPESVNLFFVITHIKNQFTDSCGNRLLQNDLKDTLCEISSF